MVIEQSVLDNEDKQRIKEMIEKGESLRPDLARAQSAGIDIGDSETKLDNTLQKLRAIESAFFPNG